MRLADSFWLINVSVLLALILGCRAGSDGSQAAMMSRNPTTVALCKLTMAPKAYTETLVEVNGRITATKEGIDMWDPSCSNRGVDLSVDFDSGGGTERAGRGSKRAWLVQPSGYRYGRR